MIPAYNEEEAIGDDLDLIRATMEASGYDYEVIVVDDGSRDRTAEIVQERPWVRMIQHPYNRGVGAARTTGVKAARGEVIVMTDGDGTYPNQDIPRLLAHMDQYDMVIGARKREAGSLPWLRAPAKHFIRLLASYLAETRIPDPNSGFRAFRKEVALRFLDILPRSHSWVGTITLAFLSEGFLVKFIPIDYYRRKGRSTFHPLTDTYNYISLVVRTIMYFNPLKVFLPLSLFLIVVAFIKLIRDFIVYHGPYVPGVTLMLVLTAIQVGAIGLLADLIVRRSKS
ncbi:MAG: glycosyltransferase family 2 protein [Anaerolineae bacterium]